ncbi:MAG: hypothetical protein KAJ73_10130 [Zetaproteobacteria bacterium]|nr:hypothetical protein [Zetaproteobacteria bacterium]
MQGVTVKKEELLAVLKANREKHRAIFEEALEGYRAEVVARLDAALKDAKAGKKIVTNIRMIEPMDQTGDYDRIIRMVEMEVDHEVDLDENSFRMYVMDDWAWKEQFLTANLGYTKSDWKV